MAASILFLPFRRTHQTKLSGAVRQYISDKYDQHPEMFRDDMEAIDRLRADAISSLEPHVSCISRLQAYAAQLVWIGGKFPIDMGVDFVWYTALGFNTQRPIPSNNLKFELANVVYDIASLYSQLAVSMSRSTSDGLKSACNYFCQAAGVVAHLKDKLLVDLRTDPPEDMDNMTLECLQHLLLAQGQECFWSKAVKDGMKDGTIAKLAAKVSDFYDQAAEFGTKSDIISTEWIHHMTAKHHHFAAAAQYRASRECLEKQEYGEEIARLKDSLQCVKEALKESRWIHQTVLGDLKTLQSRVSEDLARAEKDNDVIYLMSVPPKSELKLLGRAGMAIPRCPAEVAEPLTALGDHGSLGRPLFARLVPYSVHVAASIYEDRKKRVAQNMIIDEIESLTQKLRDLLQSLNLPGSLQALERPLGLPPSVVDHADEIQQQEGLHKLRRSIREIQKLKENDIAIYDAGVQHLHDEAAEDDGAKLRHGTRRWQRESSADAGNKLYAQAAEIQGYLKSAASSDDLVKNKLRDSEKIISLFEGSTRELEDFVPSSRRVRAPPQLENAALDLRRAFSEVSQLEARRRRQIAKVQEKMKRDDINQVILAEAARIERERPMQKIEPVHFEDLFDNRLVRYEEDRNLVPLETDAQKTLSAQIQRTNSLFLEARKGDSSSLERERALQELENGYIKYKEMINNLNTGREFYNKLAGIVNRFRDECKTFYQQRRHEASLLESELENAMNALNLGSAPPHVLDGNHDDNVKHRNELRAQYTTTHKQGAGTMTTPSHDTTIAAPIPTRTNIQPPQLSTPGMWTPEVGIKFGGASTMSNGSASTLNVHNPPYPSASTQQQQQQQNRAWDMTQGIRFG